MKRRTVLEAVRAEVGAAYPIGVKLNSSDFSRNGLTPEASVELAVALEAAGTDLVEISCGNARTRVSRPRGRRPAAAGP